MGRPFIPLRKGDRYNLFTVQRRVEGTGYYICRCDCGTEKQVHARHLRAGTIKACGCTQKKAIIDAATKHGMYKHPLWGVLNGMLDRCYNQNCSDYHRYGGRGIRVCRKWRNDKKAFFDWALANGWAKGLEIDRKNNDRGYGPKNCHFVTRQANQNNRYDTIWIDFKGEKLTLPNAVREYGQVSYNATLTRITRGWSVERALTEPPRKWNRTA